MNAKKSTRGSTQFARIFFLFEFVAFVFSACLFGQIAITDPANGDYVSGTYEVRLSNTTPDNTAKTLLYLDGRKVFEADGWHERVNLEFGEAINRHELYAVVIDQLNQRVVSDVVVTKELVVDFSETTRLILMAAVVKTRSNKPVLGLERSQFRVFEDGKSLEIQTFYKEKLPLDLVFLLDTSSSLRDEGIEELKYAAQIFLRGLDPADRVALYEFKKEPLKIANFTTNRRKLIDHITQMEARGETALFNTLLLGLKDLQGRRKGRKALVLFTDGRDSFYEEPTEKARLLRKAITIAQNQEVTIFTIGLGQRVHKPALERIAEETGGRFHYANKSDKLRDIFTEIILDLKNQYIFGVRPKATRKGFHRLEIKVKKRNAVVFSRKGYTLE